MKIGALQKRKASSSRESEESTSPDVPNELVQQIERHTLLINRMLSENAGFLQLIKNLNKEV